MPHPRHGDPARLGRGHPLRLLLAALVLLAGGCRSLPDTREALARPIPPGVEFEGSAGPVSSAANDRIVDQLEYRNHGTAALQKHLAFSQALNSDSPLVLGNRLLLLQNGPATYVAMFAVLHAARDSINIETYIFDDDQVGTSFADLLLERQAAGVQVNIIHDGFGTIATKRAFFDRLTAAGIRVLEFNPLNPTRGKQKGWHFNHRDHRKLMLIDGRIAFVGGINISDSYSSAPLGRHDPIVQARLPGWRDTHVRIEGPVVAEFQKLSCSAAVLRCRWI